MKSENHTETACFFYVGKWKKVFPAASRVSLTVGEIWECGKGVEMGVGNLKNAEINAFSVVFKKVWECGNNFQETENFMEFQNVFQEMLNVTAAPPAPPEVTPPPGPVAAALQRAGISTDAPYYAGAFQNVGQALENRKPTSRCFWEAYLLSLCGHMERLTEHADKEQERQALHGSIQTVQAVLYALQEAERTESEPRERA